MAGIILLSYVLGVLISQPEIPLSTNGVLTKLSGDSAFSLMSLLGASMMPHNFYLHSSIVRVFLSSYCTCSVMLFILENLFLYVLECVLSSCLVRYGLNVTRIDLGSHLWEERTLLLSFFSLDF